MTTRINPAPVPIPGNVIAFLKAHQNDNSFFKSLWAVYTAYGRLTERQVEAIEKSIPRGFTGPTEAPKVFHAPALVTQGQVVGIKQGLAERITAITGKKVLRNLEITKVLQCSAEMALVTAKPSARKFYVCQVCSKPLTCPISKAIGMGPLCCARMGIKRPSIKNAELILQGMDRKAAEQGSIGPFWIPKNQLILGSK